MDVNGPGGMTTTDSDFMSSDSPVNPEDASGIKTSGVEPGKGS